MAERETIRIGGACGFWGDADLAVPQLLKDGDLDYIVFDYLAEITLSIMARAHAKDQSSGYAADFVTSALAPNLREIERQGVKVISNAGGVNPLACAEAVRGAIDSAGLRLKVAVVTGDGLVHRAADFVSTNEMFTGDPFPSPDKVASINVYLGAFPIADALSRGADIVITGRCVDSAVTLGACIHAFGWEKGDWHKLAAGSLAGHLIECGPQATGGNFTDWDAAGDGMVEAGYPIAEISRDGVMIITKPPETGGLVTVGTVAEQLLYEIGDPQSYVLPDVVCDLSHVRIEQQGPDRVSVTGAQGRPAPNQYKASVTWTDGFRAGASFSFVGESASAKARQYAKNVLARADAKLRRLNAAPFDERSVEVIGDGGALGASPDLQAKEVVVKIAVKHQDMRAAALMLKEATGLGLSAPPGLTGFSFGRPKPSPIVRLFSMLVDKSQVPVSITVDGEIFEYGCDSGAPPKLNPTPNPAAPDLMAGIADAEVPLIRLAWARSGDKGDKANIGVMPRRADYAPWIWAALSEEAVAARFADYVEGSVARFYLPGTCAMNILMDKALGGGGIASLRNDPQGKTFSQILLTMPVRVPRSIAEAL